MKCSMQGSNARVLHKILQNMAKIGCDLYLGITVSGLSLRTKNFTESSYMMVNLFESFFLEYHHQIIPQNNETMCRISLKTLLSVFRNIKKVKVCTLRLNEDSDILKIRLRCAEEKIRMMKVPILENKTLDAVINTADMSNTIVGTANLFLTVTNSLQGNADEEATMDIFKDKTILKNYIDDRIVDKTVVRTRIPVHQEEFQEYNIVQETRLTFCLRSFRAIISLPEALGINTLIKIAFNDEGQPMLCTLNEEHVEAYLLMSTLERDKYESSFATTYDEIIHSEIHPNDTSMRQSVKKRPKPSSSSKDFKSPAPSKKPRSEKPRPELMTKSQLESADTLIDSQQVDQTNSTHNNTKMSHIQENVQENQQTSRDVNRSPIALSFNDDNQQKNDNSHANDDVRSSAISIVFQRDSSGTQNTSNRTVDPGDPEDPDVIPASPPCEEDIKRLRTRKIFRRCFEETYHFSRRPEKSQILAYNSDSD